MDRMAEPAHRTTIREIADLAGVSIATVSRVLNGRGDVAEDTRELVSRIIRDNGYTANRSARGLSAGRSGLVGVLVPLVYPAYFSAILSGAAEALAEQDLRVVLSPTGHEHDREVTLLERLMHGLTDGALIVLPEESSEELERLLDELEERGLVERRRDPADRRRHIVELTPDGKRALAKLRALAGRLEDEFLAQLDEGERAQLHELLVRLSQQHLPACAPLP